MIALACDAPNPEASPLGFWVGKRLGRRGERERGEGLLQSEQLSVV